MYIKYYKWSKKEYNNLNKKANKYLYIDNCQFYYPILSLFFYYHNTKRSKKVLDINRRFRLLDILNSEDHKVYNSNKYITGLIFDHNTNIIKTKNIFAKCTPIIDIFHYFVHLVVEL